MAELKRIAPAAVPMALDKALRYRLLNEPLQAESICLDILEVEPSNQEAIRTLILALADRFERDFATPYDRAKALLAKLETEYDRAYYEGIIHERWAKAQLARRIPGATAVGWLREAMRCYSRAEELSGPEEPDAVLRWNTCARLLDKQAAEPAQQEPAPQHFEAEFNDDVPMR